jgi:hypothetical protein
MAADGDRLLWDWNSAVVGWQIGLAGDTHAPLTKRQRRARGSRPSGV